MLIVINIQSEVEGTSSLKHGTTSLYSYIKPLGAPELNGVTHDDIFISSCLLRNLASQDLYICRYVLPHKTAFTALLPAYSSYT